MQGRWISSHVFAFNIQLIGWKKNKSMWMAKGSDMEINCIAAHAPAETDKGTIFPNTKCILLRHPILLSETWSGFFMISTCAFCKKTKITNFEKKPHLPWFTQICPSPLDAGFAVAGHILPHIHPFMHTFAHRQWCQLHKRVAVRCLAQGHLDTRGSN